MLCICGGGGAAAAPHRHQATKANSIRALAAPVYPRVCLDVCVCVCVYLHGVYHEATAGRKSAVSCCFDYSNEINQNKYSFLRSFFSSLSIRKGPVVVGGRWRRCGVVNVNEIGRQSRGPKPASSMQLIALIKFAYISGHKRAA